MTFILLFFGTRVLRATNKQGHKMDYKSLAISIASAEDPYGEFAKEASDLDEINKTTLAREVNKQFFISRLNDRDGDGAIDFDVIKPELEGTHVTREVSDPTVEKTASDVTYVDKASLVNDSMFVLTPRVSIKASSSNNALLRKTAEDAIDEDLISSMETDSREFTEKKSRAVMMLNDMFGAEVENITKMANDASELRGIMGLAIESGLGSIVPEMVAISNDAESTLHKVASVDMDRERTASVMDSMSNLVKIAEIKTLAKEASSPEDLEKVAVLMGAIGALGRGAFSLAKGGLTGAKYTGKAILGAAKIPTRVLGATKNLVTGQNFFKGWEEGGSTAAGLGTLAVTGGAAAQFPGTIEKYHKQINRI